LQELAQTQDLQLKIVLQELAQAQELQLKICFVQNKTGYILRAAIPKAVK
jgi:hypothetical protein